MSLGSLSSPTEDLSVTSSLEDVRVCLGRLCGFKSVGSSRMLSYSIADFVAHLTCYRFLATFRPLIFQGSYYGFHDNALFLTQSWASCCVATLVSSEEHLYKYFSSIKYFLGLTSSILDHMKLPGFCTSIF